MRAAIYSRTGPARDVLSIEPVDTPVPAPGEVRVRIAWSGVNPSDVKARAGLRSATMPFPRVVPHSDGAGVIESVGEGVPADRIGQRVWLWNAAWGRAAGTAAEFVVLPQAQAVPLPEGVDLDVGACLGIPALTAMHAVLNGRGVAGRSVLVAGGAGAVGNYAVQMAKQAGARQVLASVSSGAKADLARAAGADVIVNYREQRLVEAVREATQGEGVERIIEVDLAANAASDFAMVRTGGDIVVYGSGQPEISVPFVPAILKNVTVAFFIVYNLAPADRERATAALTAQLVDGGLRHNIAARLPLEEVARAHELVESGRAVGNVVLRI
jgi:NADPH:quinone reductase